MTHLMRRATLHDLPDVLGLLGERANWLQQRGLDQWQLRDPARDTEASIGRGDTWVLASEGRTVATITMSTIADADFWTEDERAEQAVYLSKMTTSLSASGQGLGAKLVDCANTYASSRGVPRLRWDVWRSNHELQDYYANLDAHHVRTVDVPGRLSGALFELAFQERPPTDVRMVDPVGTLATAATRVREPVSVGVPPGEAGDHGPMPSHWHVLDTLSPSNDASGGRLTELLINGDLNHDQISLLNAGDGWRVHSLGLAAQQVDGDLLSQCVTGRIYRLRHVGTRPYCTVALRGDIGGHA
ncbi:MAG TPA: GNAT family N-acetyltransferase [Nocardioidaceae bacterium]|nr:GNAT family N-acetyltransferase [Nocardioidaceae bacterium]